MGFNPAAGNEGCRCRSAPISGILWGRDRPQGPDRRHRLRTIRPYEYEDAAKLLEDFWKEVDQVLRERGSIP